MQRPHGGKRERSLTRPDRGRRYDLAIALTLAAWSISNFTISLDCARGNMPWSFEQYEQAVALKMAAEGVWAQPRTTSGIVRGLSGGGALGPIGVDSGQHEFFQSTHHLV